MLNLIQVIKLKKKKLKDATCNFIPFKAKIYQLDINKWVIVQGQFE